MSRQHMGGGMGVPTERHICGGSVGEPINPEAWWWYREVVGGGRWGCRGKAVQGGSGGVGDCVQGDGRWG